MANKAFLVVNTSYFGDTLLTSSLVQNLKAQHPHHEIIFLANAPFASVAAHLKGVDTVLAYDKKGAHKGLKGMISFYREYKDFFAQRELTAAFVIYGNERGIMLAKMWGAKQIFSHNTGLMSLLLNNPRQISYPNLTKVDQRHSYLYHFLQPGETKYYPMAWEFKPGELEDARALLNKYLPNNHKPMLALNPLSKKAAKDLPIPMAKEIIQRLKDKYTIILLGTGEAAENYALELAKETEDFTSLVGKTSLTQLAGVLKLCAELISVDTGTMHLGLAVGVSTTCLFFINDPAHLAAWAPLPTMYKSKVLAAPISIEEIVADL